MMKLVGFEPPEPERYVVNPARCKVCGYDGYHLDWDARTATWRCANHKHVRLREKPEYAKLLTPQR